MSEGRCRSANRGGSGAHPDPSHGLCPSTNWGNPGPSFPCTECPAWGSARWPAEGSAGVSWIPLQSPVFASTFLFLGTKGTSGKVDLGLLLVLDISSYSTLSVTFCLHAFTSAVFLSLTFVRSLPPSLISHSLPGSWPHLVHA